ncbi:unnamed protein product [Rhizopus stolonifer]
MKQWNSQKKFGTNSTRRLKTDRKPTPNDSSETHKDISLETGHKLQLSANLEAKQVISSRYEDSDKLKVVGQSAAEIFEGLDAFIDSGDEDTFIQVMEKVRQLSIFGFASSQEIDREARELTLTALRLPQHAKYLED